MQLESSDSDVRRNTVVPARWSLQRSPYTTHAADGKLPRKLTNQGPCPKSQCLPKQGGRRVQRGQTEGTWLSCVTKSSKMLPLSNELQLISPSSLAPQHAQVEEKGGRKEGWWVEIHCRTMAEIHKDQWHRCSQRKKKKRNEVYPAQHLTARRNKQNTRY